MPVLKALIIGDTPTAHLLAYTLSDKDDVLLSTVSWMLTPEFSWTTPDGVTRIARINNGSFLSVEHFSYGWNDTTDNPIRFVFISLTSSRIFQRSLDVIKSYVADDVVVFVDASIGILLENMVHRSLPQLICLSVFNTGTQVVFSDKEVGFQCRHSEVLLEIGYTGSAWAQLKHNKERDFQYHHVLKKMQSNLSNDVVKVSDFYSTREEAHFRFHCKLWRHYTDVSLDLLSIANGTPGFSFLLSGDPKKQDQLLTAFPNQYVYRNMLNDILSLVMQVSGLKVFAELFGSSNDILNCNMAKLWEQRSIDNERSSFLTTHGSYALMLVYQIILASDETHLQCSTFEFLYAQLCLQVCSPGRLSPLPMWLGEDGEPVPVRLDDILEHTPGWYHITSVRSLRFLEKASPTFLTSAGAQHFLDIVQSSPTPQEGIQPPTNIEDQSAHNSLGDSDLADDGVQPNEFQPGDSSELALFFDAILNFADKGADVEVRAIPQEQSQQPKLATGQPKDLAPTAEEAKNVTLVNDDTVHLPLTEQHTLLLQREITLLVENYREDPRLSSSRREIYLRRGSRWFSDEQYSVDIDDQLFRVLDVEGNEDLIEHATLINSRFPGPIFESHKLEHYSRKLEPYQRKKISTETHGSDTIKTLANVWKRSFLNAVRRQDILWSTRDQYGSVTDPGSVPSTLKVILDIS